MTTLTHLFGDHALTAAIEAGNVRVQTHPALGLRIFNYTEKCTYEQSWDEVTLNCRGLIADNAGTVVARPFRKFFNHGQPGAPALPLDEPVRVTDKADGSLGIVYPTVDGPAVATRGSFTSDQAQHATAVLRGRYPGWAPPPGVTMLVEIIYPANRIVLDYAGLDDLVLLGAVEIATGRSHGPEAIPDWPGPVAESFAYPTLGDALAAAPRPGKEGLVVHAIESDVRVKVKYAEYLNLHRVVFGLSARSVWEKLGTGATVTEIAQGLPDEFHPWVGDVATRLITQVQSREAELEKAYAQIMAQLPTGWTRKDFALPAQRHPLRGMLFARLDGRPLRDALWQEVKPGGDETPHGRAPTQAQEG